MIYVYRKAASTSARDLAAAIEGRRYRGVDFPIERKVRPGDIVVCWGQALGAIPGVQVLNGTPLTTKFEDATRLAAAGVATIQVARVRPTTQAPVTTDPALPIFERVQESLHDFGELAFDRAHVVFRQGVRDLQVAISQLHTALLNPLPFAPAQVEAGWLGRMNHHVGGNDLLTPTPTPDYFAKKVDLVSEFRIHSFQGKSIRAGVKVPREGMTPHAWIRSMDGGWKISYDGVTSRQAHRELAHQAVAALGLQFGAVDIGQKADNSLVVLEVNRAPGLEGGTIEAYARAIEAWLESEEVAA